MLLPFLFKNRILRLNNLKTRTAMNTKISVFVACIEAIILKKVFKSGPSKFRGRQPLKIFIYHFSKDHIPWNFLKAVFHKIYLVLSWILCPIYLLLYNLHDCTFKVACEVKIKFYHNLIIPYENLGKVLLLSRNQVFCLKIWKLWRAPTILQFNIFCWNLAHVFYLPMSTKGCVGFFYFI